MSEVAAHLSPSVDLFAGYTFLEAVSPQGEATFRNFTAESENYQRNLDYLGRIATYCQKNDIQLLLFLTPTKGRIPTQAQAQMEADVSALSGVLFVDFNDCWDELDIDDSTDWYDSLHLNFQGAEKFSRHLADYLTNELGLSPTAGADQALWQSRVDTFSAWKASATG